MVKTITPDAQHIKDTLQYFKAVVRPDLHPHDLLEIRAFRSGYSTACGLFKSLKAAAITAVNLSNSGYQVYSLLNPIDPKSDYAKKNDRFINTVDFRAYASAHAGDIARRRLYLFDFDPPRPDSNTCSTHAEKATAWAEAKELVQFLYGLDWPEPVLLDSGNGYHVVYLADDSPVDKPACDLLKGILRCLKVKFPTLDASVFDANRLHRVPWTQNSKGTWTIERPHRRAQVLDLPDPLEPVPAEKLLALEFELDPQASYRRSNPQKRVKRPDLAIDEEGVEEFIREYSDFLQLEQTSRRDGVSFFALSYCPFKGGEHRHQGDKSAIILSDTNIGFKCFSDDCVDYNFQSLLQLLHDETGRWPKVRFRVGMTDEELEVRWGGIDDLTVSASSPAA
jgi:hypothetical protein